MTFVLFLRLVSKFVLIHKVTPAFCPSVTVREKFVCGQWLEWPSSNQWVAGSIYSSPVIVRCLWARYWTQWTSAWGRNGNALECSDHRLVIRGEVSGGPKTHKNDVKWLLTNASFLWLTLCLRHSSVHFATSKCILGVSALSFNRNRCMHVFYQ